MSILKHCLRAATLAVIPLLGSQAAYGEDAGLIVNIDQVRNDKGTIWILVFDNEAAYDAYDFEKVISYKAVKPAEGDNQAKFPELTKGPYAIGIFHDENNNDDFDMARNGYPLEGYGTSGADTAYSEPDFKEASVMPDKPVHVRLFYPNWV